MTSVSNLRAQFDPDSDQSHRQQAARNAALRGAQLAFPRPSSVHNTPSAGIPRDQTDARSAASVVAGRHANGPPKIPPKPAVVSSASIGAVRAHKRSQEALHLDPHRRSIPDDSLFGTTPRSDSPSSVAAVLAAARFSPHTSQIPKQPRSPYSTQPRAHQPSVAREQLAEEDQIPIRGTVHDVRKWLQALEEDTGAGGAGGADRPTEAALSDRLASHSRKNSRQSLRLDTSIGSSHGRNPDDPVAEVRQPHPKIVSPRPTHPISVTESLEAKMREDSMPQLPGPEHESRPRPIASASPRSHDDETPPSAYVDAEEAPMLPLRAPDLTRTTTRHLALEPPAAEAAKHKPEPPLPRRSRPSIKAERTAGDVRSIASKVEEPSLPARARSTSASRQFRPPPRGQSLQVDIPKRGDLRPRPLPAAAGPPTLARKVTPHMTGDSLANAIVAGSLASSRAPSPTKSPGPGFHSKQNDKNRLSVPFFSKDVDSRTPSPAKGMRHTMRKADSSSSSDERSPHKRSRKFLIRKHPHKHNEGDRKRWRDEMTALERKRYEGVWAANKGFYVDPRAPDASDSVSNLLVRDIWRRSRLPDHVLEEVWELADTEMAGRLGRVEFVVGLWLIDQRLKGRKLPVKVQPSVWRSARGVHGLKVRKIK